MFTFLFWGNSTLLNLIIVIGDCYFHRFAASCKHRLSIIMLVNYPERRTHFTIPVRTSPKRNNLSDQIFISVYLLFHNVSFDPISTEKLPQLALLSIKLTIRINPTNCNIFSIKKVFPKYLSFNHYTF